MWQSPIKSQGLVWKDALLASFINKCLMGKNLERDEAPAKSVNHINA